MFVIIVCTHTEGHRFPEKEKGIGNEKDHANEEGTGSNEGAMKAVVSSFDEDPGKGTDSLAGKRQIDSSQLTGSWGEHYVDESQMFSNNNLLLEQETRADEIFGSVFPAFNSSINKATFLRTFITEKAQGRLQSHTSIFLTLNTATCWHVDNNCRYCSCFVRWRREKKP